MVQITGSAHFQSGKPFSNVNEIEGVEIECAIHKDIAKIGFILMKLRVWKLSVPYTKTAKICFILMKLRV